MVLAVDYSTLRENLKKYCDVANQDLETIYTVYHWTLWASSNKQH